MTRRFAKWQWIALASAGIVLALAGVASASDSDVVDEAALIGVLPFVDEGVDVSLATVSPEEPRPSCAPLRHTSWYVIELDADTPLSVRAIPMAGSPFDVGMAAWALGTDGHLVEVGCVDAKGPGAPERMAFAVAAATRHYLQVGAIVRPDTYPGAYSLLVEVQLPEHDLFAFAVPIDSVPFTDVGIDATIATRESGEPEASCAELTATTWYRMTPHEDTVLRARVIPSDLAGNMVDTAIAVYSGTQLESLSELACVNATGVQSPEVIDVLLAGGVTQTPPVVQGAVFAGEMTPAPDPVPIEE